MPITFRNRMMWMQLPKSDKPYYTNVNIVDIHICIYNPTQINLVGQLQVRISLLFWNEHYYPVGRYSIITQPHKIMSCQGGTRYYVRQAPLATTISTL